MVLHANGLPKTKLLRLFNSSSLYNYKEFEANDIYKEKDDKMILHWRLNQNYYGYWWVVLMFLIHHNNSELTGQIATQSVNSFPFCLYAHMKVCAHPLCNMYSNGRKHTSVQQSTSNRHRIWITWIKGKMRFKCPEVSIIFTV